MKCSLAKLLLPICLGAAVIAGLAPVVLFVTGVLMWWNRVVGPATRQVRGRAKAEVTAPALIE